MKLDEYMKASGTTQAELARRVGVTPPMVWQWLTNYRGIAAERVLAIEAATDGAVTRYELRPDIYPLPKSA